MSHRATIWAIQQKGLKPAARVVLWHLADHHNPELGCFPSQETLADECEMCIRSVRDHLNALEARGLIRRVKTNSTGRRVRSDRYLLAFEDGYESPESAVLGEAASMQGDLDFAPDSAEDGAEMEADERTDTGKTERATPANSREKHRQNLPPNLVKEPVREPGARSADAAPAASAVDRFSEFWEAYPVSKWPNKDRAKRAFRRLLAQGQDPVVLVEAARRYAQEREGECVQYTKTPANWLSEGRWKLYRPPQVKASPMAMEDLRRTAAKWAEKITRGEAIPLSVMTPLMRDLLLAEGVNQADLRRLGVDA